METGIDSRTAACRGNEAANSQVVHFGQTVHCVPTAGQIARRWRPATRVRHYEKARAGARAELLGHRPANRCSGIRYSWDVWVVGVWSGVLICAVLTGFDMVAVLCAGHAEAEVANAAASAMAPRPARSLRVMRLPPRSAGQMAPELEDARMDIAGRLRPYRDPAKHLRLTKTLPGGRRNQSATGPCPSRLMLDFKPAHGDGHSDRRP